MGRDWSPKTGIPSAPFICEVLFHFYFGELDQAFEIHFPNFPYARYEVFVPIPLSQKKDSYVPRFFLLGYPSSIRYLAC